MARDRLRPAIAPAAGSSPSVSAPSQLLAAGPSTAGNRTDVRLVSVCPPDAGGGGTGRW